VLGHIWALFSQNHLVTMTGSPFDVGYFSDDKNSTLYADDNVDNAADDSDGCHVASFTSVGLLLAGIISARFGLWMSDLVFSVWGNFFPPTYFKRSNYMVFLAPVHMCMI
jgi:hypothetical protein